MIKFIEAVTITQEGKEESIPINVNAIALVLPRREDDPERVKSNILFFNGYQMPFTATREEIKNLINN